MCSGSCLYQELSCRYKPIFHNLQALTTEVLVVVHSRADELELLIHSNLKTNFGLSRGASGLFSNIKYMRP